MSDVAMATAVKAVPTKKPESAPEQPRVLKATALAGSEYAYATFSATLPVSWTVEDALKPEFWVNVAHKLAKNPLTNDPDRSGAIIELRTADHAFYARLYVRAVQERGLVVALMGEPVYFGPREVKSAAYKERWNVGPRGYDIIRVSDNEIVAHASKIKTKEQVQAWIDEAMKVR